MRWRKILTPFKRVARGREYGAKVTGGGIAATGTAIGILTAAGTGLTISLPIIVALGGGWLVTGLVGAYIKGKAVHLPINLIAAPPNDQAYTATFCTAATLKEADELTRPYYGAQYVPPEVAEEWRKANPHAFVHLSNANGEVCSSFSVMGLEKSFMSQFIKGRVTDDMIRGEDVLDFDQTKRTSQVYIGGVVVRDPETMLGHKRTAAMLWAMTEYFRLVLGARKTRLVYALAVNKPSENILIGLGFKDVTPWTEGHNGEKLFFLRMDAAMRKEIAVRVANCAAYTKCAYESALQSAKGQAKGHRANSKRQP